MKKIKQTREDVIFDITKYTILTIAALVILYPLYFIVIASISNPQAINSGQVWLRPVGVTFEGYRRIMLDDNIWTGYRNTSLYTVIGTALSVFLTLGLAYPLSRKDFPARKYMMFFLLITMYFNGGLIPRYVLVNNIGLYDTFWVMILLQAVNMFNVIIARTFLQSSIPDELYEAASIDGCTHIVFLWKVVLPLSKALIAVLILYYGVAQWNEFFTGLIYLSDKELYPLQLVLRSILIENQAQDNMIMDVIGSQEKDVAELIKYGIIIVSSLPVLIIYPFLQNYFVQGVMIGSVKG